MKDRIKGAAKTALRYAAALAETILSAVVVVLLYAIYIPFGICRALTDRKAVRWFYDDVFLIIDALAARRRRKEARDD